MINRVLIVLVSSIVVSFLVFILLTIDVSSISSAQVKQSLGLDTEEDGPIWGDIDGLKRVKMLEDQFHNMRVRSDHPRIIINAENLPIYRACYPESSQRKSIESLANKGDMVNSAFVYLMTDNRKYADVAIQKALTLSSAEDKYYKASASLVFDWCYNVMTEDQKKTLMDKIVKEVGYFDDPIPDRNIANTFHTEEWSAGAWSAWPEIALAHHYPRAEDWYKARWQYDWVWGDGARALAYIGDGNRPECYPHYGMQLQWFWVLRSSTGINIIDSPDIHYFKGAGYLNMYKTDFGTNRMVFFKGANRAGSLFAYDRDGAGGSRKDFGAVGAMTKDPFVIWGMNKVNANSLRLDSKAIETTTQYIWNFIVYNPKIPEKDPKTASWDELPLSRLFPGSKKAIMRSSWGDNSIIIGFRNLDFKAQWHVPADANTFYIYRKGLLSGENGCRYLSMPAHSSYWQYAAISHNNLLVIDPSNPKFPTGSQGDTASNSGGPETITSHNFGLPHRNPMLHDYKRQQPGGIPIFRANPEYTYLVGDAKEAYRSRLNEFYRNMVFIPLPNDKGYFIVFDRVETKKPELIKKWLLHFCDMPQINGNKVSEEVPEHIESFDGDLIFANNVKRTSVLFVKALLPKDRIIRRVGGKGYEFWRDDTQKNYPPTAPESFIIESMGGPDITDVKELGFARVEISPTKKQNRDYFLNVMYIGEPSDIIAPIELVEKGDLVGVIIRDPKLKNNQILFTKTGTPDCQISSSIPTIGQTGKPRHIDR